MLVLTRKLNERINIHPQVVPNMISIRVIGIRGGKIRIAIEADKDSVLILREEIDPATKRTEAA